jgi:hypothetical protein
VHVRRVDPSDLVLSLSSHRHSYIGLLLTLTLSILNKRSNRLIGKLTAFLQLQEFNLRNRLVDCPLVNLDGSPIVPPSHTHPSHSQTFRLSSINLVSIFRCSSPPINPVYTRRVDPSALVLSLSSHRHSYIGLLFSSHFIHNKQHKITKIRPSVQPCSNREPASHTVL